MIYVSYRTDAAHTRAYLGRVSGNSPQFRTLHLALDNYGGEITFLAEALGVSVEVLSSWLAGNGDPPLEIHLAALELIATGERAKRSQSSR